MSGSQASDLVIFGASNILSDIFDCAHALGLRITKVVLMMEETVGPRDKSLANRIADFGRLGHSPIIQSIEAFEPQASERYILGPTTPLRAAMADELHRRFGLAFTVLVHPSAYVSPLAELGGGVFIGANSVIAPGVALGEHVFVNRGVTIGHDTRIGPFSRVQPGSNLGGLSRIGRGVTIGIGATLVERLQIGDHAFIGAGAVVLRDVEANLLVFGAPAKVRKRLANPAGR